jgi:SAM-dependent methyltransferase
MVIDSIFKFKPVDEQGLATLEAIAEAPSFNAWMYAVTSANMQGRVLEIGSGIGNISQCYLNDKRPIMLSDIRENYCNYLNSEFGKDANCLGVRNIDLVNPNFESDYADLLNSFDSVFALNVVEHIFDDQLAIANAKKLLKTGGRLLILVPAYQRLFNGFDVALEHYRRYNAEKLRNLFLKNGLQIQKSHYFNLAAIAGWWFSGSLLKKQTIPSGQMRLYDALVPVFKIADKLVANKIGISVIVEGIK